jgi:release factor glutamine methyltransferase
MNDASPSIRTLLARAAQQLSGPSARLDAEVLLAACLERTRSYLHAWPERRVPGDRRARFLDWLQRRMNGEPVAYLTGQREFWSLPLKVTRDTLIPRPETETLVSLALARVAPDAALRIADLGTGAGAIALAVARARPRCGILATDVSEQALAVARENAGRLGIDNVRFRSGPWCTPLAGAPFDLILSNPPYVAQHDPHLDQGDVRYEPRTALVAGPDGLDELRRVIACAARHLGASGWLLVEHGCDQGAEVMHLLRSAGYRDIGDHADDAGLARVALGRRPDR